MQDLMVSWPQENVATETYRRVVIRNERDVAHGIGHLFRTGEYPQRVHYPFTKNCGVRERVFIFADDLVAYPRLVHDLKELSCGQYFVNGKRLRDLDVRCKHGFGGCLATYVGTGLFMAYYEASMVDAHFAVSNLAVALSSYRQKTSSVPTTLTELVPDHISRIPMDPYTGSPPVLARSSDEITIYCVGPDGTTDIRVSLALLADE